MPKLISAQDLQVDLVTANEQGLFKWIRIVYRCWRTSNTYDEKAYLKALVQRGFALIKPLPEVFTS